MKRFSSLEEIDFNENRTFTEPKSKSRPDSSLQTSLPEITERKNNSAPPLELTLVPYKSPETSPKIQLPGSVASTETTPKKLSVSQLKVIFLLSYKILIRVTHQNVCSEEIQV